VKANNLFPSHPPAFTFHDHDSQYGMDDHRLMKEAAAKLPKIEKETSSFIYL
jgi:hypothetical protein